MGYFMARNTFVVEVTFNYVHKKPTSLLFDRILIMPKRLVTTKPDSFWSVKLFFLINQYENINPNNYYHSQTCIREPP